MNQDTNQSENKLPNSVNDNITDLRNDMLGSDVQQNTSSKKPQVALFIFAAVILFGGIAAAAYSQLSPANPEEVWSQSLENSSQRLFTYLNDSYESQDELSSGFTVDGSYRIDKPTTLDGVISGKVNGADSFLTGNIGFAGLRIQGDTMTKAVPNSSTGDFYFKLNGLQPVAGLLGLATDSNELSTLVSRYDDQWLLVDHTLTEEFLALAGDATEDNTDLMDQVSPEEAKEFVEAAAPIMNKYVFASDTEDALFEIQESFGLEEFKGDEAYRYRMQVNKDNLKKFLQEYSMILEETSFTSQVLTQSNMTIEEFLGLEELYKSIDESDPSDLTAEVWVDEGSESVRTIRFNVDQANDLPNYIEFDLPYDSTDELPFLVTLVVNEGEQSSEPIEGSMSFGLMYNQITNASTISLDIDLKGESDEDSLVVSTLLTITPNNDEVDIDVPLDAVNVLDILNDPELSQLLNDGLSDTQPDTLDLPSQTLGDSINLDIFGI